MREKYIERRFPLYYQFGEHPDGRVGVVASVESTSKIDLLLPKDQAEELIKERQEIFEMVCKLANKLEEISPDEFTRFWYG